MRGENSRVYFHLKTMLHGLQLTVVNRKDLYTDIKLNDTLCGRYQAHMGNYQRNVLKSHEKILAGSSDVGLCLPVLREYALSLLAKLLRQRQLYRSYVTRDVRHSCARRCCPTPPIVYRCRGK